MVHLEICTPKVKRQGQMWIAGTDLYQICISQGHFYVVQVNVASEILIFLFTDGE